MRFFVGICTASEILPPSDELNMALLPNELPMTPSSTVILGNPLILRVLLPAPASESTDLQDKATLATLKLINERVRTVFPH